MARAGGGATPYYDTMDDTASICSNIRDVNLLNCSFHLWMDGRFLSLACQIDRMPSSTLEHTTHRLDTGGDVKRQIITPKSCADAGVGGKGSPQALGSAGRYPHTCHQATGMIGEKTRPRLLHVRYKRIQMYGSISTGKLPSHQRDPMEGDCLTKHSASWACKGGGAPNPAA